MNVGLPTECIHFFVSIIHSSDRMRNQRMIKDTNIVWLLYADLSKSEAPVRGSK